MQYREYGRTGKKVSVIGFGGMRFVPESDKKYDYDKCADIVRKANELGVNYFDTAPGYCADNSEQIFGRAFQKMPGQFYVSTKSGEMDGAVLRAQLERSLKRLGLQKINFYNIWSVKTLADYKNRMKKGGPYEAAAQAKKEGLIEHLVFSTHCSGEEIELIARDGVFEGVTLGYNIINFPFRQKGIKAAYAHGMGVVVMNPLSGGLIPKRSELFEYLKNPDDATPADAALRFLVSQKEITTNICGMGRMEEVLINVKAGEKIRDFPESKKLEIQGKLSLGMDKLCTGCQYCEYCPQEIEVSKHMLAYNQTILEDKEHYFGQMKWHWDIPAEQADACTECGICEEKCTQHINIKERLKEISKWVKERKEASGAKTS